MGRITIKEEDTQTTPASGYNKLYPKTDGKWHFKDDTGTEKTLANSDDAPASHAATHKGDGADAIAVATTSVAGLMSASDKTKLDGIEGSGVAAHASTHQNGGADEISVAGLSGVLADRQDADKIVGEPITITTVGRRNHLVYDEINEEWINEKLPCVPYGPVICYDWSPTWADIEDWYKFIPCNTEPSLLSHVGNGTVAYLNGITPVNGDSYTVTDTGTLTAGSLAVTPGAIVIYYGAPFNQWFIAVQAGDGATVVAGLMVQLSTTTALISPYTDGTDDGKLIGFDGTDLIGVETSQDITITLPDPGDLDFNDGTIKGMYYVGKMSSAGTVRVVCSGVAAAFMDGVESVLLTEKMQQTTLAVVNASLASVWMRISQIPDVLQVRRAATWASTNFSSLTGIPFDTEDEAGNPDITDWNSGVNPSRVTAIASGHYTVSGHMSFSYPGTGEYDVAAQITKNGVLVAGTSILSGSYRGNVAMTISPVELELAANDYLELKIQQTNLSTGVLEGAVFVVKRTV